MSADESKVTIHMVASLDFFIARKEDDDFAWLESSDNYEKGVVDEDPEAALKTIDCWVIGSRTYEAALELGWPYGDIRTFVLTHRDFSTERENVRFYSGDLKTFFKGKLKPRYKNIWVVGGNQVAKECIDLQLVDNLRITIAPVLLGEGVPFVDHIKEEQALHLKDVVARKNGFVELWYEIDRDQACET